MSIPAPNPAAPVRVVLVTGLSGAGKASVLRTLEDLGYETVDNPPLEMLEILVRGRIQTVHEVPYQFGIRRAGRSKANASVAIHYLHLLGRLSRDMVLRSSEP